VQVVHAGQAALDDVATPPCREDALPGPIELPERPPNTENYQRPPKDQHIVVDSRFWEHAEIGT
jgi:hypothetical protein